MINKSDDFKMKKLEVHLENCYGIKELKHTFNFCRNKSCIKNLHTN